MHIISVYPTKCVMKSRTCCIWTSFRTIQYSLLTFKTATSYNKYENTRLQVNSLGGKSIWWDSKALKSGYGLCVQNDKNKCQQWCRRNNSTCSIAL